MSSLDNNSINDDNDLKFVPLNIEEPFKTRIERWVPFVNLARHKPTTSIFLGLPPMHVDNNSTALDSNPMSKLPTPCIMPNMTPFDDSSTEERDDILDNDEINRNTFLNSDSLYCYNESSNEFWENRDYTLQATDILKMFDFSLDLDNIESTTRKASDKVIDKAFDYITESNSSILGALKAYKIPAPIAALIIKRIIKSTLDYIEKE